MRYALYIGARKLCRRVVLTIPFYALYDMHMSFGLLRE